MAVGRTTCGGRSGSNCANMGASQAGYGQRIGLVGGRGGAAVKRSSAVAVDEREIVTAVRL